MESEEEADSDACSEMALLNLQDLNETDLKSMKGDTVGDTVYSSKWIIETLMSLSKVRRRRLNIALAIGCLF